MEWHCCRDPQNAPGMNDMNTQMQIRSMIPAPILHPTIAPPPISAPGNGDLEVKLISIIDLQSELAQLAANLANLVNGGSKDHFMLAQGILHQVKTI